MPAALSPETVKLIKSTVPALGTLGVGDREPHVRAAFCP